MPETQPRTLNHFSLVRFTPEYWTRTPEVRKQIRKDWLTRLASVGQAIHVYQAFGIEAGVDLIVWTAAHSEEEAVAKGFFERMARAWSGSRMYVEMSTALWGFTKPSQYTKTRSTQELDPFETRALPYLVMYPFVKTSEWYLHTREERANMMFEHIKIGKQFPDITQLLLYSTGLQDQEFVVVYETDDLLKFSQLVTELRSTKGRPYTLRDTPLHTAVRMSDDAALDSWL